MKISQDWVPSTVKQAVDHLYENTPESEKQLIRGMSFKKFVFHTHHSLGRYLRNSWELWSKDTPLKLDAIYEYNIAHGDDVSGLILDWFRAKICAVPFCPNEFCKKYFRHWGECGMTPLEAGGITYPKERIDDA